MRSLLERRERLLAERRGETVVPWIGPTFRFGLGATDEVGYELARLGVTRALVVTDSNVAATGLTEVVRASAAAAGVETVVWAGAQTEPTDESIRAAIEVIGDVGVDGFVGLGGGSAIDTCKLINLLLTYPADLETYLAKPHGQGVPVPGPLAPMIGVPTTAGTGSECTPMAIVDVAATHTKAAVSHYSMRPAVAIIDPLNALSCPPRVTASSGYDAVVQALESLTSLALGGRPPATSPAARPVYVGHNPISSLWCEEAVRQAGRHLVTAVVDGDDVAARTGMALAALCSRLGNAGVHLPHANAYAVVGAARDYWPAGFTIDRHLVPHGESVVVTAPAAFDFTYAAAPERHLRAAELLGVPEEKRRDAPELALGDWLRDMLVATDGPRSLEQFGIVRDDVPTLVDRAMTQERILVCSPREVTREGLTQVLEASFAPESSTAPAEVA